MQIKVNKDQELVKSIRQKLKENGGYCPCSLLRNEDAKCMCKEFREMKQGECHCGLYIKVDDSQEG